MLELNREVCTGSVKAVRLNTASVSTYVEVGGYRRERRFVSISSAHKKRATSILLTEVSGVRGARLYHCG